VFTLKCISHYTIITKYVFILSSIHCKSSNSSVFFGAYSFHQRSQAIADTNTGNYPIDGVSNALSNKYLIAQVGILNRPFAHSKTFNTNVIEQMYRGKMVDGKWQSSDSVPGGLAGAMRRQLSKGVLGEV
jgi:hypothetical protein